MPKLEILGVPQSNFVRTVRMALIEKKVDYTLTPARAHSPEIMGINPFGKIPAMRHGTFTLFESRAIIAYVDDNFAGPNLVPEDARSAAKVEQWIGALCTAVHPAVLPYVRAHFMSPDGKPDRALLDERLPVVRDQIGILDRAVAGGALAGTAFSLADMYLLPLLAYLRMPPESGEMVDASSHLAGYFDIHSRRASFVQTAPPPMSELRAVG